MKSFEDTIIFELIQAEEERQKTGIELIPSENYASAHVRRTLSSCLVNKYSEGYPGRRYYGGNQIIDDIEKIAQERAKKLFGVEYVNVQPYSGSPANLAVYLATCKPGDHVMGQALIAGGHLTHGHGVSATGIFYNSLQYGVSSDTTRSDDLFDYEAIQKLAREHKPKLIWVGATAYPLLFNYERFADIADDCGAYLVADIAHVAGLIAGGVHPSPVAYAHIVTTTTHKTLRGPRGAMIMVTKKGIEKDPELPSKIDKAVFPGLQGGPHDNTTAGIAVALFEAMQPAFKSYAKQIVANSQTLAQNLIEHGYKLVGNGSQNHLILMDLSPTHGPGAGIFAEYALDHAGLTMNKNTVPAESSSPFYPSGLRLGTAAATTRGMKEKEMTLIGNAMHEVLSTIKQYKLPGDKVERNQYLEEFRRKIADHKRINDLRYKIKKMSEGFIIP